MNGARMIFDSIGKLSLNEENLGSTADCNSTDRLTCSGDNVNEKMDKTEKLSTSPPLLIESKIVDLVQLVEAASSPVVEVATVESCGVKVEASLSSCVVVDNHQPGLISPPSAAALKRQSKGLLSNLCQLNQLAALANLAANQPATTSSSTSTESNAKAPPAVRIKSSSSTTNETPIPIAAAEQLQQSSPLKKAAANFDTNDKKIKKATQGLTLSLESKNSNSPLKDTLASLVQPTPKSETPSLDSSSSSSASKHHHHQQYQHHHAHHHHHNNHHGNSNHHDKHQQQHDGAETPSSSLSLSFGSAASSSSKSHHHSFNIENELIKYTKSLKLNHQSFTEFYKLGAHIRNGGFSEIYEGTQLKTNDRVIIKLIPKRKTKNWLLVHNKKYPAEVLLHKMCNHVPGVVKMLEFFEQEHEWIIIMPKILNCMDLFDYLESKHRGRLDEAEARHFFTQLVRINIDLYNLGVVHRDIKSENILVDLSNMNLVLIDFGASAICKNSPPPPPPLSLHHQSSFSSSSVNANAGTHPGAHFYTDFHGTRQYKPPEYIATKKYSALSSTAWTLGILLYDMCNGQLPFETEQEIIEYNLQIKTNVSNEYKKLLLDCLHKDPRSRPTLYQILEYSWCKQIGPPAAVVAASPSTTTTTTSSTTKPQPTASAASPSQSTVGPGSKKTTEV